MAPTEPTIRDITVASAISLLWGNKKTNTPNILTLGSTPNVRRVILSDP